MKYRILAIILVSVLTRFLCCAVPYETEWYTNPVRNHFYEIKNTADFDGLVHLVNERKVDFESDTISIQSDLNLTDIQSISTFSGCILGNNHTISNLRNPLVSEISASGVIESINFDSSCEVSSGSDLGIVCRTCKGIIKNCISYASIYRASTDSFRAGGICGNLTSGKIMGCQNYGKISGTVHESFKTVVRVGGICGYIGENSKVIGCMNYGPITATAYAYAVAGGIVGDSQDNSLIENCINNGKVTSTITGTTSLTSTQIIQYTGGIAGQEQYGGIVNMCSNYGEISNNTQYVSGIVGHAGKSSIMNCANYGNVTSIENFFFSCACGICSYFNGVSSDENYIFANCINTGTIYSTTKNAIATAAGICNEIKNAKVANLLSSGTAEAFAYGVTSANFSIPQFETSDCQIISQISSIEEANNFIDSYRGDLYFVKWQTNDDNHICLANTFSYFIDAYEGFAVIYCFSGGSPCEYTLSFDDGNVPTSIFEDKATINNLIPDKEYRYSLSSNSSRHPISGSFKTSNIGIALNIDSIAFTKANLRLNITARGCSVEKSGVKYRKSDSSKWNYFYDKDIPLVLTGLEDNTEYDIKPICHIFGAEYEGDYYSLNTPELIPWIVKTGETSSSLSFKTSNLDDLRGYDYGLLIKEKEYYPDSNGIFCLTGLACDGLYSVDSYIIKNSNRISYHVGDYNPINFETGEGIQISSNAAMVKVRVGSKKMPDYPYFDYNDYRVEVKGITEEDNSEIIPEGLKPIYTGNTFEHCVTFKCPSNQPHQYRLRVGTTERYFGKYDYLYGEWKTIDPRTPNVQVVEPIFTDIKTKLNNNNLTISCSNVPGEENILSSGLEYRLASSETFNKQPISPTEGILTKTFSSLVPGYEYVGRFYNEVENNTYYSNVFTFKSDGEIELGDPNPPVSKDDKFKLSILYPEQGIIQQMVGYYESITFHLSTPKGWYINYISLNSEDITENCDNRKETDIFTGPITTDTVLAMTFCQSPDGSDISEIINMERLRVYSIGNKIYLETSEALPSCQVLDLSGNTIFSGTNDCIEVPMPGVYILNTNKLTYKLYVSF